MENLNNNGEVIVDDNEELLHMKTELKIFQGMQKALENDGVNGFFNFLTIVDEPGYSETILNYFLTDILEIKDDYMNIYSKSINNKFGDRLDDELRKAIISIVILLSISTNNKNSIFLKNDHQGKFYKYNSNIEIKLREVGFEIQPNFKDVECYSMYDDTINILLLGWNDYTISEVGRISKEQLMLNQNIFKNIVSYLYKKIKNTKEL